MPTIVAERQDSPELVQAQSGDAATLEFNIYGTSTPADAMAALTAQAPASTVSNLGNTIFADRYRLTSVFDDVYTGEVSYKEAAKKKQRPPETDETRRSFTISATNKHIDRSLETITRYTDDPVIVPPDFQQLIGVTKDAVEGTDILVPEFTFEITKYVPLATITDAWVKQVADIVGTVANATFKGFPKGEVLLTSISGANRSDTDAELTFSFARAKNETLQIGNLVDESTASADIVKEGWQFLWIFYEAKKDAAANRVVRTPRFAYVERVYEYGDYTQLGAL